MFRMTFVAPLVLVSAAVVAAQAPAFTRTLLQQVDLSTAGREAVTARAEFLPGGTVGRHTHFGEEIGYVIEEFSATYIVEKGKPLATPVK